MELAGGSAAIWFAVCWVGTVIACACLASIVFLALIVLGLILKARNARRTTRQDHPALEFPPYHGL